MKINWLVGDFQDPTGKSFGRWNSFISSFKKNERYYAIYLIQRPRKNYLILFFKFSPNRNRTLVNCPKHFANHFVLEISQFLEVCLIHNDNITSCDYYYSFIAKAKTSLNNFVVPRWFRFAWPQVISLLCSLWLQFHVISSIFIQYIQNVKKSYYFRVNYYLSMEKVLTTKLLKKYIYKKVAERLSVFKIDFHHVQITKL